MPVCLCMCLFAALPGAGTLHAQDSYRITPDRTTMLIGEWRVFRMVDQNGSAQQKVTWTISDASAFQSMEGDELRLSPRRAGNYRLTARTDFAVAEGTVTAVEGSTLPPGTMKWRSGGLPGCTTTGIIPAVRVPNGPDFFQQTHCEDGEYVAAYTSNGVQLWRRKISEYGAGFTSQFGGNSYETVGSRLDARAPSLCDSISVGMEQQRIRDVLTERKLSYHEEPPGGRVWLVEEFGTQCRLWFDEKLAVAKKTKVFVAGFGEGEALRAEPRTAAVAQEQPTTKQSVIEKPATEPTAPASATSETAKSANKPKHVITNDDIKPSPYAGFGGLFYMSTGTVNDCDAMCFDQVRMFARVDADKSPHWRQELLQQLDMVRSDGEWQRYLHQLYDAHNQVCALTFDKNDELRRSGNQRNLGPLEVAIADKYDEKMSAAKAQLQAQEAQQTAQQRKFADKPYANAFATVQEMRMRGGFCSQWKVIYPTLR